ncbi:MAG: hypothetical protein EA428_08070 [Spirochaetaceae bacterium]|nr:MAG: hypothetical protein EA428_08070 [Spirochaetaceae bacterium]
MGSTNARTVILIAIAAMLPLLTLPGCSREQADLGTEQEPLVWLLSPEGDSEQLLDSAEAIATRIYELTGLHVSPSIADSEASIVAALAERPAAAHITTLNAAAYLHASDQGMSAAALLGVRGGQSYFRAYFITHEDSGIATLGELLSGTLSPRMAIAERGSLTGYIMPLMHLREAGLDPEDESFTFVEQNNDAEVIAAVYRREIAVGAITQDLREEVAASEDFEAILEQVSILGRTDRIPQRGLQFSPVVPEAAQRQILNALLQLSEKSESQELIRGLYGWESLREHGDEPYEPVRELMRSTGVTLEEMSM